MTEEEKAAQKARPIATNPIPGTPWLACSIPAQCSSCHSVRCPERPFVLLSCVRCVVWTGDDRVFFYNPTTRLSMWDRPEELVGRADVDKHIQEPPHKRGLDEGKKTGAYQLTLTFSLSSRPCGAASSWQHNGSAKQY